ncbi:MAG: GDP-mannose 4,6-dehydratase [Acidobacteria bacterium]|nr:MAG: GDP-mannose 4,6-dehydratase [Acidobacteriota bacterium]
MSCKTALITGIAGQDGSYLSELLLAKGYTVRGIVRRASYPHTERVDHLLRAHDERDPDCRFKLDYADLGDVSSLRNVVEQVRPDEVYNLASQSHVGISFITGESTLDFNAIGPFRLLDTLRRMGAPTRYYQASSSEMFGASPPPQNETTPFLPQSPYGVSKVAAFYLTRMHRVAYGMFAANGILFNHESPRRGINFVTRKITRGIASILTGEIRKLYLGNLDAKRDWGFSGDYVEAIWRILQQPEPDDFVIATGDTRTVREFLEETFSLLGLVWEDFVEVEDRYMRPAEVPALLGDASKARRVLAWEPKVRFKELCRMMLEGDLAAKGLTLEAARALGSTLRPGKK